ncbi:MAG TPA: protein translocase subunit SecF [Acidimicrobiales bacterium]
MTAVDRPTTPTPAPAPKTSIWHRLYHGETTFDFVGKRRIGFTISAVLIVVSAISLIFQGLNLGIDFEGGVAWEFQANGQTVDNARSVLEANGINPVDAKIQTLSGSSGERLRVQVGDQPAAVQTAVKEDFAKATGENVEDVSVNVVSPTWGSQITKKAIRALIAFFVLITIYISIRFEWRMAIAALLAVFHDVFISVGIYSIFGFEVTPATVIAFLTILGFSLYDTIVVFDKVHENTRQMITQRASYGEIVNKSMNQVLMRSINTSLAAVLPVISLLVIGVKLLGAVALEDFALALLVGLLAGSYSSIFVATPILALLKGKDTRTRPAGRSRAATPAPTPRSSASTSSALEPAPGTEAEEQSVPASRPVAAAPATPTAVKPAALTHAPRPRKKRRR